MDTGFARRKALTVMAAVAAGGVVVAAGPTGAASAEGRRRIPDGFAGVDPRTARRVPLWQPLATTAPIFEGDPPYTDKIWTTIAESGYLLEQITSLGTHTGTHISAPAHFVEGAKYLDELDERWTLMPLTVIDVRAKVRRSGGDFFVDLAGVKAWEKRYGRFPAGGCVLLLTGFGALYGQSEGGEGPYFDPAPGLTGEAVAWLFEQRGTFAVGSDTFGPDATADEDFSATSTALQHGGITVENVGAGLSKMRPHGDWISINGGRPHYSGFQMGITGFTV